MGLLDIFNTDGGALGLGLLAAAGPRADGAGFGQRMAEGVNYMQAQQLAAGRAEAQKALIEEQRMRAEQIKGEQLQRQAQAMQAAANQRALRSQFAGPSQGAPGQPAQFDPRQFLQNNPDADISALEHAVKLNGLFNPTPKYETLAPGSSMYRMGPNGPELAVSAPKEKNPNQPFSLDENGNPVPNRAYQEYELNKARSGASNVSVNTGQKGFDNTLKLRGDFRSEPIYKAHQEVQSAYSQIQQGLKMASPAGDLAGATKIMKLLDPGSVVRESELGMAMAATGAMDRLTNYAENVMKGTKLTPNQRADFQNLADKLYGESVNQYNSKRVEYQGIAERNGLNTADILGPEAKSQTVKKIATLSDIAETARRSGKTTAQVTEALKAKGYTIGGQ